jgi:hypothetical protein
MAWPRSAVRRAEPPKGLIEHGIIPFGRFRELAAMINKSKPPLEMARRLCEARVWIIGRMGALDFPRLVMAKECESLAVSEPGGEAVAQRCAPF